MAQQFNLVICIVSVLIKTCFGQNIGTFTPEHHLPFNVDVCDSNGCNSEQSYLVLDADYRWCHVNGDETNCLSGSGWNSQACPDSATCTANCALDGISEDQWLNNYGVQTFQNGVELGYVTDGPDHRQIGSRMYIMAPDDQNYRLFKLKNREFTFDMDVSNLPCGLDASVYFSEMLEDGGTSKYPTNKAGARYGTGYCDAQCFKWIRWVGGEANMQMSDSRDDGKYGVCCHELDIIEANSHASATTLHNCHSDGYYLCTGDDCDSRSGNGKCDGTGCDVNAFRNKNQNFYGRGSGNTIDTTKPFTVVTQFITSDGTDNGDLVEIRKKWIQDGNVHDHPGAQIDGMSNYDSLSDDYCRDVSEKFDVNDMFLDRNGMKGMGESLDRGMVLVLSLWDDATYYMLWLDSHFPVESDINFPGVHRGDCPTDSGRPLEMQEQYPDSSYRVYNFKVGTIGSTF